MRWLITAYAVPLAPAFLTLAWLFWTRPAPLEFPPAESESQLRSDARSMDRHLDQHSGMQKRGVSRMYFDFIHDSIVSPRPHDDYSRNRPLSQSVAYLHRGYREVFENHTKLLGFLLGLCITGALAATAAWRFPRVPSALLMLVVPLATTSPGSEFFAGQDFVSLYLFGLPHAAMALALFVLLVRRFTLTGTLHQQEHRTMAILGALCVLFGVGGLAWSLLGGGRSTLQGSLGVGSLIGYGLIYLFQGLRGLWKTRH